MRAYFVVIAAFVDGRLTVDEFKSIFIALFKHDPGGRPEATYQILDTLFGDADAYDPNAGPDEPAWLDESELRIRAAESLARLREIADE